MTIESDKYICFKEEKNGMPLVRWLELQNNFAVKELPLKSQAQNVILHPDDVVITLRALNDKQTGHFVQIFHLGKKKKLNSFTFESEKIEYWTWLDPAELAIITGSSIYHWKVDVNQENQTTTPVKIFDRSDDLKTKCQVLGYTSDPERQTCILYMLKQVDGGIVGKIQFYLAAKDKFQVIDGCGADIKKINGLNYMAISRVTNDQQMLGIKELAGSLNLNVNLSLAKGDFVVYCSIATKLELIYLVTFNSVLLCYDLHSGMLIGSQQISNNKVFEKTLCSNGEDLLLIDRKGNVFNVGINKDNIAAFLKSSNLPNANAVLTRLADKTNISGVGEITLDKFNKLMALQDYPKAAELAANSTELRNKETLNKFISLNNVPNQKNPVLFYFKSIMVKNQLNDYETVCLAKLVLQQDRDKGANLLNTYLNDNKITCTDELGDLVSQGSNNQTLAQAIYKKSGNVEKIVQTLVLEGNWTKLVEVAKNANDKTNINWDNIVGLSITSNPQEALKLARVLAGKENNPVKVSKINVQNVAQVFVQAGHIKECTGFLISALKENKPEDAHLQTKLFELNLNFDPQQAEQIFQLNLFTNFDRDVIARLCEQKGLFNRALQYYTAMGDIKRVVLNTTVIPHEFIISYLDRLSNEDVLTILRDLMIHNPQVNGPLVSKAAVAYFTKIGAYDLIKLFESTSNFQGLYMFLGAIVNDSKEPYVVKKYIECCLKVGNKEEVNRVVTSNEVMDPSEVRDFLLEAKLADPMPLILLSNKFNYIEEMITYLLNHEKFKRYIDYFIFNVNPKASPKVLKILMDENQDERYIKGLLDKLGVNCNIAEMIEVFDKENRLSLTVDWLDGRIKEGNQMVEVHNSFMKIQIDAGKAAEQMLNSNTLYDTRIVGKYCEEKNDYELALVCYRKGQNDAEILKLCSKHSMYKHLANYLTKRKSEDVWKSALGDPSIKSYLVDQINSVLLNDYIEEDEIQICIKSFMDCEIYTELSDLLEKLIFYNKRYQNNGELQQLLISNSFHTNPEKSKEYIQRFDDYDAETLARQAYSQFKLYEQTFLLYKKAGTAFNYQAIEVLLNNLDDHDRAVEFAKKVKDNKCYSKLAKYQIQNNRVKEAILNYIEAKDDSDYLEVITQAEKNKTFNELIDFLRMVREIDRVHDRKIDNTLLFTLAKLNKTIDFDTFMNDNINVDWKLIGEKCMDHKLFEYAKKIFQKSGNHHKMTMCLVHLGDFNSAMEYAKKANSVAIWYELFRECVRFKDFSKASIAGLNVIQHQDWVEKVRSEYEKYNLIKELVILLESGLGSEKVNNVLLTELGILYCQYDSTKLMNHCRTYIQQLNTNKLIRYAELNQCWREVVFLYFSTNQFDNAINTIIEHSPEAFSHEQFLNIITKVTNQKLLFKGILFYLEEEPSLLNNLLQVISSKLDSQKLVQIMQKTNNIEIISDFLKTLQHENNQIINDEINRFLIEEEDVKALYNSINTYSNFDQTKLLKLIDDCNLLEIKKVSALIYRQNKQYEKALTVCKEFNLYLEAMETVRECNNTELAIDLIESLLGKGLYEYYACSLYACYEHLTPDLVMEWNWLYPDSYKWSQPFFIQMMKETYIRITGVEKKNESREKKEKKEREEVDNTVHQGLMMNQMNMLSLGYQGQGGQPGGQQGMGGPGGNSGGGGGNNFSFKF